MSQRTLYECDRCGAEILNQLGLRLAWTEGMASPVVLMASPQHNLDLCGNCRLDFEDFRKSGQRESKQPVK